MVAMKADEERKIGTYIHTPAQVKPYDPDYPKVAAKIAELIRTKLASVIIEHIGSTAIPDCRGKGIIDLMVLYPRGFLDETQEILFSLGFQRQPHKEPFPESRPMRVGSVTYKDKIFQIHVHVIEHGNRESYLAIKFRDKLCQDRSLMREYIRLKEQIIKGGLTDSLEYCKAKQVFIKSVLAGNSF